MDKRDEIDPGLVAKAAAGDRRAFDVLWRELNPRLLRYLASRGLRDRDDVASQAWLEAFQRLDSVDDRPGAFRRLLFTIARRRMVDEIRQRGRSVDIVDGAEPTVEEAGRPVVELDAVLSILTRLPAAQAEVIALRVIGGLSAAEVGEITGQSPGAVRVMSHRALQALQRELVGESELPEPDAPSLLDL